MNMENQVSTIEWNSMDSAPKDGRLLRLLVNFTDYQIEDVAGPQITIGCNTWDNHHDYDYWQFVGWNWEEDCFSEGLGEPLGWLPLT